MQAAELTNVTLEEFEAMEKDERFNYELINGIVMMSPSPSKEHQTIAAKLFLQLGNQLEATNCQALFELDIIINGTRFRPDSMVFCEDEPNEDLPIIIFEILSPSTRRHDLVTKLSFYEQIGIAEYWIVDPKSKSITIHDFINAAAQTYIVGEIASSTIRPEIRIELARIF